MTDKLDQVPQVIPSPAKPSTQQDQAKLAVIRVIGKALLDGQDWDEAIACACTVLSITDLDISKVLKWVTESEECATEWKLLKGARAEVIAAEVIAEARQCHDPRSKLNLLKWAAERLSPADWGERQQIEHSGSVQIVPNLEIGKAIDIKMNQPKMLP